MNFIVPPFVSPFVPPFVPPSPFNGFGIESFGIMGELLYEVEAIFGSFFREMDRS